MPKPVGEGFNSEDADFGENEGFPEDSYGKENLMLVTGEPAHLVQPGMPIGVQRLQISKENADKRQIGKSELPKSAREVFTSEDAEFGENEEFPGDSYDTEKLEPITGESAPPIKPGMTFGVQRGHYGIKTNLGPLYEGSPDECIQGSKTCLGPTL